MVGLYLAPPQNAIVLCVDEKSQIQALDRTQKTLPMQPGLAERRTHDYVRHGTSTLFAALDIATGKVTAAVKPRHRHTEFLAFLKQVARAYPDDVDQAGRGIELHMVMDNYLLESTHSPADASNDAPHAAHCVPTWFPRSTSVQVKGMTPDPQSAGTPSLPSLPCALHRLARRWPGKARAHPQWRQVGRSASARSGWVFKQAAISRIGEVSA
ncbi:hypothetical protein BH24ACT12_BH24ACT12_14080 [soil metagenome]